MSLHINNYPHSLIHPQVEGASNLRYPLLPLITIRHCKIFKQKVRREKCRNLIINRLRGFKPDEKVVLYCT